MARTNTEHLMDQGRSAVTSRPQDLRLYRLRPPASLTHPVGLADPGAGPQTTTADLSHQLLRRLRAFPLSPTRPSSNGSGPHADPTA